MKTYYKPTQMRGKRVIFKSIDPAEDKRQKVVRWVIFICLLTAAAVDVVLAH